LPNQATVAQSGGIVAQRGKKVAQSGKHKRNYTKEIKQEENSSSSNKDKAEDYKNGKRNFKPYFIGEEMRWYKNRWWVIPKDGSPWLEFSLGESDIEWR